MVCPDGQVTDSVAARSLSRYAKSRPVTAKEIPAFRHFFRDADHSRYATEGWLLWCTRFDVGTGRPSLLRSCRNVILRRAIQKPGRDPESREAFSSDRRGGRDCPMHGSRFETAVLQRPRRGRRQSSGGPTLDRPCLNSDNGAVRSGHGRPSKAGRDPQTGPVVQSQSCDHSASASVFPEGAILKALAGNRRRWDSNPRITDLQSAPLVHSGTSPQRVISFQLSVFSLEF